MSVLIQPAAKAKLHAYRRNGVREYVVHRVLEKKVDWFVLKDGRFEALSPSADGLLRSTIFPGLWLDPAALVRPDPATVLAVIQQGVNSPEHAEFAASLKAFTPELPAATEPPRGPVS